MMKTITRLLQVKKWKPFLFSILFMLCSYISMAQIQVGADIDGEAVGDHSGYISMPDAYTIAIGASTNDGNGMSAGHVRIYKWNGTNWVQKGSDIDGEVAGDQSGLVSMPDSSTVAIGAFYNSDNGFESGHVRIFQWNGFDWIQKGMDIDGEAIGDRSGFSVSMADNSTVAIGAYLNDGNGTEAGHVRIYTWNGTTWAQKGLDIDGESAGDKSSWSISMPDSNTLAIGAPYNDGTGASSGHARVFRWNGNAWIQKGRDLDGDTANILSGATLSMPDSNTVAIGVPLDNSNGFNIGHVRIFRWNGNAWVQKGGDIYGEAIGDQSGNVISMADSNTVAIGAYLNDGNGTNAGHVRIYGWNGSNWRQIGIDIDGEAAYDYSGNSISMPDSNTVAIGAILNDGNGIDAGHARVYSLCDDAIDSSISFINDTLISNNTNALYQWVNCDSAYSPIIGEKNQMFIPTTSGSYAVIVSKSHCVDTSVCHVVSSLSELHAKKGQFTVYPNPTKGIFTIESNVENKNLPFEIRNITGKIIQKGKLSGNRTTLNLSEYSSGVYLLRVGNQNIKLVRK